MAVKELTCKKCGLRFKAQVYPSYTPQVCSRRCSNANPSLETREKMRQKKLGYIPWNKGIHMWENREHPRGTLGMKIFPNGRTFTEATKKKMSETHRGVKLPDRTGELHHWWRGGISTPNERIRASSEMRDWRRRVFGRDDFTCQECGVRGGVTLHADHIKPFSLFPELRFELSNGRTLCVPCHKKTDTYGGKMLRKNATHSMAL